MQNLQKAVKDDRFHVSSQAGRAVFSFVDGDFYTEEVLELPPLWRQQIAAARAFILRAEYLNPFA